MSPLSSLSAALLSFLFAFPSVTAFSFSFQQTPTSCDNLALTWTGGTPPFQLLMVPLFGTQRNISIPSSAFSNGQGSFSVQIPLSAGKELVLTMSDATGLNSGGTTDILTVGASQGGTCSTMDPGLAFSYQLNTALQQCRPFTFSGYGAASQPVTITGIIPGGDVFVLTPPTGSDSFSWNAAVARGTSMVFLMTDSQGRPGGVSDIEIVTSSDDATCLNANSPTTTTNPPSTPTTSKASTTSATSDTSSPSSTTSASPSSTAPASNGVSIAAIAGTVIGALLFLAVIITLGLFFLRKRRDEMQGRGGGGGGPGGFGRQSRVLDPRVDLNYDPANVSPAQQYGMPPSMADSASAYPYTPGTGTAYASNPFLDSTHSLSGHRPMPSQFDGASMYTDARYAQSEADQYEMPTQYGYNSSAPYQSTPQPTSQLYPPPQNYLPGPPHPTIDPFVQQYPTPPGAEFDPLTPSTQTAINRQSTSTSTSAAQRKAAAAGVTAYKPSRFIMHTDVEDALPPTAEEEEVIELPPQYSERRGPPQIANPSTPAYDAGHSPGGHSPGGSDTLLPYS